MSSVIERERTRLLDRQFFLSFWRFLGFGANFGSSGADATTSMENIREQVHV